jgi:hypothetical protein
VTNDPTDATTIPPDVRHRALMAALVGVANVIEEAGHRLYLFGKLELLDLALDEAEDRFTDALPPLREN